MMILENRFKNITQFYMNNNNNWKDVQDKYIFMSGEMRNYKIRIYYLKNRNLRMR